MITEFSKIKPFRLVKKDDDKQFAVVAGNVQVIPQKFDTIEEAEKYLSENYYEVTINLISILIHYALQDLQKDVERKN